MIFPNYPNQVFPNAFLKTIQFINLPSLDSRLLVFTALCERATLFGNQGLFKTVEAQINSDFMYRASTLILIEYYSEHFEDISKWEKKQPQSEMKILTSELAPKGLDPENFDPKNFDLEKFQRSIYCQIEQDFIGFLRNAIYMIEKIQRLFSNENYDPEQRGTLIRVQTMIRRILFNQIFKEHDLEFRVSEDWNAPLIAHSFSH